MIGPLALVRRLFDALYDATADETETKGIYANTRSSGGVYSITSTQSAESTYAAREGTARERATAEPSPAATYDCPDPSTCPDCSPELSAN